MRKEYVRETPLRIYKLSRLSNRPVYIPTAPPPQKYRLEFATVFRKPQRIKKNKSYNLRACVNREIEREEGGGGGGVARNYSN